jgi:hypothetical protein
MRSSSVSKSYFSVQSMVSTELIISKYAPNAENQLKEVPDAGRSPTLLATPETGVQLSRLSRTNEAQPLPAIATPYHPNPNPLHLSRKLSLVRMLMSVLFWWKGEHFLHVHVHGLVSHKSIVRLKHGSGLADHLFLCFSTWYITRSTLSMRSRGRADRQYSATLAACAQRFLFA